MTEQYIRIAEATSQQLACMSQVNASFYVCTTLLLRFLLLTFLKLDMLLTTNFETTERKRRRRRRPKVVLRAATDFVWQLKIVFLFWHEMDYFLFLP